MTMTREDYALAALGLREVRDMTKTRAELIEAGREIAEAALRDAKKRQGALQHCRFWSFHKQAFLCYDEWIKESWDSAAAFGPSTSKLDCATKMVDIVEYVLRFLESEDIEPDPFVFKLQTEEWRAGFWNGIRSYQRALAAYLEKSDAHTD